MQTPITLLGDGQELDGGAMFGNVLRTLWSYWMRPDVENRIDLGCRALLVRGDKRNVLVETGIGAFFLFTLCQRYGAREECHVLSDNLTAVGLDDADIDVALLTHLHLDHVGGPPVAWEEGQPARLLFPNAYFVSDRRHWQRARQPHPRDRASLVSELLDLLQASGCLELLDDGEYSAHLDEGWRSHFSEGHTPGQIFSEIVMPSGLAVFSGDLIPGASWVHLPLTMGHDRFPEGLIKEEERLLDSLIAHSDRLVFTHDPCVVMGRV